MKINDSLKIKKSLIDAILAPKCSHFGTLLCTQKLKKTKRKKEQKKRAKKSPSMSVKPELAVNGKRQCRTVSFSVAALLFSFLLFFFFASFRLLFCCFGLLSLLFAALGCLLWLHRLPNHPQTAPQTIPRPPKTTPRRPHDRPLAHPGRSWGPQIFFVFLGVDFCSNLAESHFE